MARAPKKRTKPARKRPPARRRPARGTPPADSWMIGAGILGVVALLGVAVYAISLNDSARDRMASFVDSIEVPQSLAQYLPSLKESDPAR